MIEAEQMSSDFKNTQLKNMYDYYNFELSLFQKKACQGILNKDHILVAAPTGCGKTLPAEVAIRHLCKLNKKVIYTTPIKALSNQKYNDFVNLFPDLNIGILTGDIQFNQEADVLIMTTEILRNTLFKKNMILQNQNDTVNDSGNVIDCNNIQNTLYFDIDFKNELGAVVFDEVHYINDSDRGHIWEETIMLLPENVQMIMLSATLNDPEKFAKWIKQVKINSNKDVVICKENKRVVPLTHYGYITHRQKKITTLSNAKNNNEKINLLDKYSNQFLNLKEETNYHKISNMKTILETDENKLIRRKYVLNNLIRDLKQKDMLPAICFVFSRKQIEIALNEIELCLIDGDTSLIVENEFNFYLRKLDNWREYQKLNQYEKIINALKKGISMHHSGIIPIFREIIEILFGKGYIKFLFATETFAVGINMPTKTVIFNSLTKYDGNYNRYLCTFEYSQMAGRAGRRGYDTVGNVIHCNNLFNIPAFSEYAKIFSDVPPTIISKFCIGFNTVLNLIASGYTTQASIVEFIENSMLKNELKIEKNNASNEMDQIHKKITTLTREFDIVKKTPDKFLERFFEINNILTNNSNNDVQNNFIKLDKKKIKKLKSEMQKIRNNIECTNLDTDMMTFNCIQKLKTDYSNNEKHYNWLDNYISYQTDLVMDLLFKYKFIESDLSSAENTVGKCEMTLTGVVASQLKEMHSLAVTELLIETNWLGDLDSVDIVGLLSCFTCIRVSDDAKRHTTEGITYCLKNTIDCVKDKYSKYIQIEEEESMQTGEVHEIHYDFVDEMIAWCNCKNDIEALNIINGMCCDKQIYLGDFVKGVIKINSICAELSNICEIIGERGNQLKLKLAEIPEMIMKYIVTSQSVYLHL